MNNLGITFSMIFFIFLSCKNDKNDVVGKWKTKEVYPLVRLSASEKSEMLIEFKKCEKSVISFTKDNAIMNCDFICSCRNIHLKEHFSLKLIDNIINSKEPIIDFKELTFNTSFQNILKTKSSTITVIKTDCSVEDFDNEPLTILLVDNYLFIYNGFSVIKLEKKSP